MPIDVRQAVALAELVAAIAEYEDWMLGAMPGDDEDGSELDGLQLAIARAFLRMCGLPARPDQIFEAGSAADLGTHVNAAVDDIAKLYRKSPIPSEMRWAVFRRDNFTCKRCGRQEDLHADHVIPESKGGPTTMENLQTLCRDCNVKKGTRA